MTTRSNQTLEDKILAAVMIVFLIKILYIIFNANNLTLSDFIVDIIIAAVIFFVLFMAATGFSTSIGSSSEGGSGSGSGVLIGESIFDKIQKRYRDLAQKYTDEKNYKKASYIYLRLLKDDDAAARVLEEGKLYNEAATVYLKYGKNKYRAAECFIKGNSFKDALKLYVELDEKEKAGDVNLLMNNKKEAHNYFNQVIEDYKIKSQYVKASLVFRSKMGDATLAQNLLMEGWKTNKDGFNCLNNYFANISDYEQLKSEIAFIYENEVPEEQRESFLQLLKHEFKKHETLEELTKEIAYEIIAEKLVARPDMTSELIHFNPGNKSIAKDVMKFKLNERRKKHGN